MSNYLTYLLNEHIQGVFTFLFFENNHDHRWNCCSIFSLYELVQYALLNYFFRRIIVTTLACFLTSCPHENNWHVFQNVYCRKTKITNWSIIWLLYEQIQDVFTFLFFLEIIMITYRAIEWSLLLMNWSSMLFQIDFSRC